MGLRSQKWSSTSSPFLPISSLERRRLCYSVSLFLFLVQPLTRRVLVRARTSPRHDDETDTTTVPLEPKLPSPRSTTPHREKSAEGRSELDGNEAASATATRFRVGLRFPSRIRPIKKCQQVDKGEVRLVDAARFVIRLIPKDSVFNERMARKLSVF